MIEITKEEGYNCFLKESGFLVVVVGHTSSDDKVLVKLEGELTEEATSALNQLSGALNREVSS